MPLIDLDENPEMYNDIAKHCKPREDDNYLERNDDEWNAAAAYWKKAQIALKDAEHHEKIARNQLIANSQSRNCKGFGLKVQKIMRPGSIDYSAIEMLKDVDLEKYRKPTIESWRITLDE